MGDEGWTSVRIRTKLIERINKILEKNENDSYCPSSANFVQIAVIQLLEDIDKKDKKIRWGKNET